jgi:hypothetical protein
MATQTLEQLAHIGYEAYYASTEGKNFLGHPLPRWDDLTIRFRMVGLPLPKRFGGSCKRPTKKIETRLAIARRFDAAAWSVGRVFSTAPGYTASATPKAVFRIISAQSPAPYKKPGGISVSGQ